MLTSSYLQMVFQELLGRSPEGCVLRMWGKQEYPGWNRMSGRKTLHCLHWCSVNFLSGNMRRFFKSGESSHETPAVCFGPCAVCLKIWPHMESVDYCFKILNWYCYLYFNLFLNCFLQHVSLPICALLCQRTDFPIKHFSSGMLLI